MTVTGLAQSDLSSNRTSRSSLPGARLQWQQQYRPPQYHRQQQQHDLDSARVAALEQGSSQQEGHHHPPASEHCNIIDHRQAPRSALDHSEPSPGHGYRLSQRRRGSADAGSECARGLQSFDGVPSGTTSSSVFDEDFQRSSSSRSVDVSAAGSTSSRHQGLAYGQQQPPVESAEERESAGSPAYTTSGPTPSASTATARVEHPLMLSLSESDAEAASHETAALGASAGRTSVAASAHHAVATTPHTGSSSKNQNMMNGLAAYRHTPSYASSSALHPSPSTPRPAGAIPTNDVGELAGHDTISARESAQMALSSPGFSQPSAPVQAPSRGSGLSSSREAGAKVGPSHTRSPSQSNLHSPSAPILSASHNASNESTSTIPTPISGKKAGGRMTNTERRDLCIYAAEHPRMKHELVGQVFGVERSTVSKILKHKAKWLSATDDNGPIQYDPATSALTHSGANGSDAGPGMEDVLKPKAKASRHPEMEDALMEWGRQRTGAGQLVTDEMVRSKALQIAAELGLDPGQFKASAGWVENFKERSGLRGGKFALTSESNSSATKSGELDSAAAVPGGSSAKSSAPALSRYPSSTHVDDDSHGYEVSGVPSHQAGVSASGSAASCTPPFSPASMLPPGRTPSEASLPNSSTSIGIPGLAEENEVSAGFYQTEPTSASSSNSFNPLSSRSSFALLPLNSSGSTESSPFPSPTYSMSGENVWPGTIGGLYTGYSGSAANAMAPSSQHHTYSRTASVTSPYSHPTIGSSAHRLSQAGINFNLSLNSGPLQTIEARQALDFSPSLISPVDFPHDGTEGMTYSFAHIANDNDDRLTIDTSASRLRNPALPVRSRIHSAPHVLTQASHHAVTSMSPPRTGSSAASSPTSVMRTRTKGASQHPYAATQPVAQPPIMTTTNVLLQHQQQVYHHHQQWQQQHQQQSQQQHEEKLSPHQHIGQQTQGGPRRIPSFPAPTSILQRFEEDVASPKKAVDGHSLHPHDYAHSMEVDLSSVGYTFPSQMQQYHEQPQTEPLAVGIVQQHQQAGHFWTPTSTQPRCTPISSPAEASSLGLLIGHHPHPKYPPHTADAPNLRTHGTTHQPSDTSMSTLRAEVSSDDITLDEAYTSLQKVLGFLQKGGGHSKSGSPLETILPDHQQLHVLESLLRRFKEVVVTSDTSGAVHSDSGRLPL